ncbi:LysR substrate-binding domain-containing protein [Martelella mediterranea]|uniref:LysR family hydrogen peroxide-inducible transcriptional activator n=1 Tax=Martelella mediterranea TaxID=293089 RepID=A0A4R3NTB4_9HYPH|nr:LysR substrate-binding domain-containing protein [Martelella mediterranea]TCT38848.1 LysR family hydrogen peroxide-inducible transcriptional activator [Martelella mediterranea]
MVISLKQLRYFEALARERHFGRAAEAVHVSQPALSAQIMEMESALGVKLVERTRKQVILTRAGKRVLDHTQRVLAEMTALEQAARPRNRPLSGKFGIGIIPTVAPYLIPQLVPYLKAHYPDGEIALKEAVTDTLLDDLESGGLDAVIAALPLERETISTRELFTDRFFVAVARNESTLLTSPLSQTNFESERLLLLEEGHCLREQALAVCQRTPNRNVVNVGATSMTTLLQMVANDMGMTLIPEMAIAAETAHTPLSILPFAEPVPMRRIGLAWRRSDKRDRDMDALANAVIACHAPAIREDDHSSA